MKTSTFKIIVALTVVIATIMMINSCKTKSKLVTRSETIDKSVVNKSDSTKVVTVKEQTVKSVDTSKKANSYVKEADRKTYTEIEFEMENTDFLRDTLGFAEKSELAGQIMKGIAKVKVKIWDYQKSKESGEANEQRGLSEDTHTSELKDSSVKNSHSEQKNITQSNSSVSKEKDSTSTNNWVGWLIGLPVMLLIVWLLYKWLKR